MKRTVIALTVTALAAAGAGVASAQPGNGAQKAGLAAKGALLTCTAATSAESGTQTANGFVVLNAPGQPAKAAKNGKAARPDGTRKLVGQVALKNAAQDAAYDVRIVEGSGCGDSIGTLTTNAQGNGNLGFQDATRRAGSYHVVLLQRPLGAVPVVGELVTQQSYASAPVTVR